MPDDKALEVVETLAAGCPAVALVVVTGRDDELLGAATIEAGASDYLPKSQLEGKLLIRCIRHAVVRKRFEMSLADARNRQGLAEQALVHQALHDPLTGLPNRSRFLESLGQALDRSGGRPSSVGAIYFDLDRFKVINESLGYAVGDQLLVVAAARLVGLVGPDVALARVGSDEFAVLWEEVAGRATMRLSWPI